jgi:hypothetical protein
MKTKHFLLPTSFQRIGWIILVPSIALGLYFFKTQSNLSFLDITPPLGTENPSSIFYQKTINLTLTISGILILVGAIIIAFSREKQEDEYIQSLRLQAWTRSILISNLILFLGLIGFYGLDFMEFLTYNMFSTLFIFIALFRYTLYRFYRAEHEK